MNRRDLLTAAPTFAFSTLLATGAQPASARPRETPVMLLAREWQALREWANGPAAHGMEESEFDAVTVRLDQLVARTIAATSLCARDAAIKLYVLAEEYQVFNWLEGVDDLLKEAKCLLCSVDYDLPNEQPRRQIAV